MDMGAQTPRDGWSNPLRDTGPITSHRQDTPAQPQSVIHRGRTWNGVSVCEMEMRWHGGHADHEITRDQATLWIVVEQIGGRYEHRPLSRQSGQRASIGDHAMSLAPAGMRLWGYADSIRLVRCLSLTFDEEAVSAALGDRLIGPALSAPRLMFSNLAARQIGKLLAAESHKPVGYDDLYGDSLVIALCSELLRTGGSDDRSISRSGLAPWQMRRVVEYMEAHLSETIQVSDFARLIGTSRSNFSLAFRRSTGLSPHRWHQTARIRRAQELLLDAKLPLVDVAYQTGFSDQSHFTKIFQRQIGVSPGAWRRQHRG